MAWSQLLSHRSVLVCTPVFNQAELCLGPIKTAPVFQCPRMSFEPCASNSLHKLKERALAKKVWSGVQGVGQRSQFIVRVFVALESVNYTHVYPFHLSRCVCQYSIAAGLNLCIWYRTSFTHATCTEMLPGPEPFHCFTISPVRLSVTVPTSEPKSPVTL